MNNITITGYLGRPVENRQTKSGKNVASLSLGSTPRIKKDGEWADGETIWFTVTVWDNLPEVLFDKGTLVMVTGELRQSSYEKDGVLKQRLEINASNIGLVHRTRSEQTDPWQQPAWSEQPTPANVVDDTPF